MKIENSEVFLRLTNSYETIKPYKALIKYLWIKQHYTSKKTMQYFPFSINASELTTVEGICQFDGERLNFEIQTKDALIGLLKTKPKTVYYDLSDLYPMEIKTGWFRGFFYRKLLVRFKSVALADKLPGNEINEVQFDFKRKYLKNVRRITEDINYSMGIQKLDNMDKKFLEE